MKTKCWRRLLVVVGTVLFLALGSVAFGAAVCKVTREDSGRYYIYTFEWTAHTDGAVASGTCDEDVYEELGSVSIIIVGVKFEPHATNPPTNLYDVVLNTAGGADILMSSGANQTNDDAVSTQWQTPQNADSELVTAYREDLDLVITNAGSGNQGKLVVIGLRYE